MKYVGKTKLSKMTLEEKAEAIEISDEADAIMTEIKEGFDRLRLSNIMRR